MVVSCFFCQLNRQPSQCHGCVCKFSYHPFFFFFPISTNLKQPKILNIIPELELTSESYSTQLCQQLIVVSLPLQQLSGNSVNKQFAIPVL